MGKMKEAFMEMQANATYVKLSDKFKQDVLIELEKR